MKIKSNSTKKSGKVKKAVAYTFITGFMVILTISFLYPLFYMFINAMKTRADYYKSPFALPETWTFENFQSIFGNYNIWVNIKNSLFIAVITTILVVVTSIIASYAFAKLRFKGKNLALMIIMVTMFLPAQVTMIPKYIMFTKLGLLDSHWAIILSYWVSGVSGGIMLIRAGFMGISNEMIESAKIDGAGFFTIVFKIMSPIAMPSIAIVIINQVINAWNDYLTPLLYITSREKQTLTVMVSQLVTKYGDFPTIQFAGLFLSVIPTVTVYLVLQKYMIKGMTSGAVKS